MSRFKYTDEMEFFLRSNAPMKTLSEVTEEFNLRFGTTKSVKAIRSRYRIMGLHVGVRARSYSKKWPKEVCEYLQKNSRRHSYTETLQILRDRFGLEKSWNDLQSFYCNHNLHSCFDGRFRKGRTPWTKGKTAEEIFRSPETLEMFKSTWFKKGLPSHNRMEVGAEVVKADGYLWRKVADPNEWRQVHILLWEKINGPVPEGMRITFLDGDRMHIVPENLMAVTMAENAVLTKSKVRELKDKDLTKAAALTQRLKTTLEGEGWQGLALAH